MSKNEQEHWQKAKKAIRFLKVTGDRKRTEKTIINHLINFVRA